MLGEVARQAGDLGAQLAEGAPAGRAGASLRVWKELELLVDAARVPAVRDARDPLELRRREPERLADVADRPARPVGREARDERGVLAPVALADLDDQLLADVPGEIEVDVGHRGQLAVQEPPQLQVGGDRIHVREAGEVSPEEQGGDYRLQGIRNLAANIYGNGTAVSVVLILR